MMPTRKSKKNTPSARKIDELGVVVGAVVGVIDRDEIMMPAMKSTKKMIGRNGTMSHPTDICESASMRIRASRRRFSSTTLSVSAPLVTVLRNVPYLSHRIDVVLSLSPFGLQFKLFGSTCSL